MGIQQKNLTLLFRTVQPETLYQSIRKDESWSSHPKEQPVSHITRDTFLSVAHSQYPACSHEEIENIYLKMKSDMTELAEETGADPSEFHLLVGMGKRLLRQSDTGLVCRFSQMLAWQNVYQSLGQDIFTTAFLAYEDILNGGRNRSEFIWDAVIKTDNEQLNTMLRQGIAENHCHLGGTTQGFPLTWACLMNHPQTIRLAVKMISRNLQANYSRGSADNVWTWDERLIWANYLRLSLFEKLENRISRVENMEERYFHPVIEIRKKLDTLRFYCGAPVRQRNGSYFVLDYALRATDCANGLLDNHNRLLSGERSFLYRCFRACFDGTFDLPTQKWFYLYLLIKENFRAEIVQVNRQAGFRNFKDYEMRKDAIYGEIPAYKAEAVRLAINANQQSQNMTSFEARIAPRGTPEELYRQIHDYDVQVDFANGKKEPYRHFYVYHFIKEPDKGEDFARPRNFKNRNEYRIKAKALAAALQRSARLCGRVWGIDAANIEIGCRPETFATEFRYLKGLKPTQGGSGILDAPVSPHIYTTYHVGEDFLDIADGLRAIDEAVAFLDLRRGDRIGHALALGVDPATHYSFKGNHIVLFKQDFLDNIIWLLYRSQELGVEINPQLRSLLQTMAARYLSEIYGNYGVGGGRIEQYDYYCAMKLRGDAPELYQTLPYRTPDSRSNVSYDYYKENPRGKLKEFRNSHIIAGLCQCYHYDAEVRKAGREVVEFPIKGDYIALMREMQESLARMLARHGIMIECNPTSNYLIGTFRRYDAHPIFRFSNTGLVCADGAFIPSPQLHVSINTDDLGIFDTSLENEYAILAACMERAQNADGGKKYSGDSIYQYLDRVRRMGLEQSFFQPERVGTDGTANINEAEAE